MRHNLSEIKEIIKDRRTIYPETYSDRKVHKEQIETVLNAALWAPTHGMTQPWRFQIFTDDARQKISEALVAAYKNFAGDTAKPAKIEKYKNRVNKSSAVIAITMQKDPNQRIPEIEEVQAVACGVQNMFLTCTAYGLGGYWSTPKFIYKNEMDQFLNLEEEEQVCLGFFYIGYPGEEWPKGKRRPLEYVSDWYEE